MAKVDWNAGSYQPSSFGVLPKGRYLALVSDSEDKPTKDKRGRYFELEFDVVRPDQYKNRKLWARLNVHNPSEVAQRIGREQWSGLCVAVGLDQAAVDDTTKLHGRPVLLIVDVEDGQRGEQNKIVGFLKPTEGDAQVASGHRPAPRSAPPPATRSPAPASAGAGAGASSDDIPF